MSRLVVVVVLALAAVFFLFPPDGHDQAPQPTTVGAPSTLARLDVADPVPDMTYSRDRFGDGWADLDGDGCNTREEVMARDLTGEVLEDGCNVVAGTLDDPYTGQEVHYTEAPPYEVQIDHVYPLHLAWQQGARQWSPARRLAFANDPDNLLAVDASENMSKGDQGPGEWLVPDNPDFACTYARAFTKVAYVYHLPVTRAGKDALADTLAHCNSRRIK